MTFQEIMGENFLNLWRRGFSDWEAQSSNISILGQTHWYSEKEEPIESAGEGGISV